MQQGQLKFQPDSGIASTVAQIIKHDKSARMVMFGLRNLAEHCSPEKTRYIENCHAALHENVLPSIAYCVKNFNTNEDIILAGSKILKGMSDLLVKYPTTENIDKFKNDQGVQASLNAIKSSINFEEDQCLFICLELLSNIYVIHAEVDFNSLIPDLIKNMSSKRSMEYNSNILQSIARHVDDPSMKWESITSPLAINLLNVLNNITISSASSSEAVTNGFLILNKLPEAVKRDSEIRDLMVEILDKFKSNKQTLHAAQNLLSSVISKEDVESSLKSLSEAPDNSIEKQRALTSLIAISYVSSYADLIVAAGAIKLLCNATLSASNELRSNTSNPQILKGLHASCKLLGVIAENPANNEAISSAGGVKALTHSIEVTSTIPSTVYVPMEAVVLLLRRPENTLEFESYNGYNLVMEVIKLHINQTRILVVGIEIFMTGLSNEALVKMYYQSGILSISYNVLKAQLDNIVLKKNLIKIITTILPFIGNFSELEPIYSFLITSCSDIKTIDSAIALEILEFCEKVQIKFDITKTSTRSPTVIAVLGIMLQFSDNMDIQFISKGMLKSIATEEDVNSCFEKLQATVDNPRKMAKEAFQTISAVNGFSQVSHLQQYFEKEELIKTILKGLSKWIQSTRFPEQQSLIKATTLSIQTLRAKSSSPSYSVFLECLEIALLPELRTLSEQQDMNDTNLIDVLTCCQNLCSLVFKPENEDSLSDENITEIINRLYKLSFLYQELKRVQLEWIYMLVKVASSKRGVNILLDSGTIKIVMLYLKKVVIYNDIQYAGLELLHKCLVISPDCVETLKLAGAVEVCMTIQKTHTTSAFKELLEIVAAKLLPLETYEKDIQKVIQEIEAAYKNNSVTAAIESIRKLNSLLETPVAIRCAVRNRIRTPFKFGLDGFSKASANDLGIYSVETSKLIRILCENEYSLSYLKRIHASRILQDLAECILDRKFTDSAAKMQGIEDNLLAIKLLEKPTSGESNAERVVRSKKYFAQFCVIAQEYPQEKRLGDAVASAVVAISKTTPVENVQELNEFYKVLEKQLRDTDTRTKIQAVSSLNVLFNELNEQRAFVFVKNGTVDSLLDSMELCKSNQEDLMYRIECANKISEYVNMRSHLLDKGGRNELDSKIQFLSNLLRDTNQTDVKFQESVTCLLNSLIDSQDKESLNKLNLSETVFDLLTTNFNNTSFVNELGKILGKLGVDDQIKNLIEKIIKTATSSVESLDSLEALCRQLAVMIPADVNDVMYSFNRVPYMCEVLGKIVSKTSDNATLLESITLVSRALMEKFKLKKEAVSSTNSQLKIQHHITSHLLPPLVDILATENLNTNMKKGFIVNLYKTLSGAAYNDELLPQIINMSKKKNLIEISYNMLSAFEKNEDIVSAIMEFLALFSRDNDGYDLIAKNSGAKLPMGKSIEENLLNSTLGILKNARKNSTVVENGIILMNGAVKRNPDLFRNLDLGNKLSNVVSKSPDGVAALMNLYASSMQKNKSESFSQDLAQLQKMFQSSYAHPATTKSQKEKLVLAYSELIRSIAGTSNLDDLQDFDVVDSLGSLLDQNKSNGEIVSSIVTTLLELANADPNFNALISRAPLLASSDLVASIIKRDPHLAVKFTSLLSCLACQEGNGSIMAQSGELKSIMSCMNASIQTLEPEERQEMHMNLDNLQKVLDVTSSDMLSMKELYLKWVALVDTGEDLNIVKCASVSNYIDYLFHTMEDFVGIPIEDSDSPRAEAFKYGCLCLELLHHLPENETYLVERNEYELYYTAFKSQTNQEVIQFAVVSMHTMCKNSIAVDDYIEKPQSKELLVKNVFNLNNIVNGLSQEKADNMMCPRIETISFCAKHFDIFNGTDCMSVLIDVWNQVQKNVYSEKVLQLTFQAMRRIMNTTWIDTVLENDVPRRLIGVVNEPIIRPTLLTDVLFLIGALSTMAEIKTLIGQLSGVEAVINLIVRCINSTSEATSKVQINACLALANITISHSSNISKFVASKGVEISIQVLNLAMEGSIDYNVANAASVLMCNVSYRRDDVKKLYGDKKGPKSITEAIRKYDGDSSQNAIRCLMSMFKAIGNMALYIPNVKTFLEENLAKTFSHLYKNCENLPDDLILVSLCTMSNLVMENQDEFMRQFGEVLVPILTMLRTSSHENAKMLSTAFDVMANLCRLSENCELFIEHDGVGVTLRLCNTHLDPHLSVSAIHLLSMHLIDKEKINLLVEKGYLTYLVGIIEQQSSLQDRYSEPTIYALRTLTRIFKNSSIIQNFLDISGVPSVIRLIHGSTENTIVNLESYRLLISLLDFFRPVSDNSQELNEPNDEWDADVADEGVLTFINTVKRPPGRRAWEAIGLTDNLIRELVVDICSCLSLPNAVKQQKLQVYGLSLLSYFAIEKIPNVVPAYYSAGFTQIIRKALTTFVSDAVVIESCSHMLINILYVSEIEEYTIVARDTQLLDTLEVAASKCPRKAAKTKDLCLCVYKLLSDQKKMDPRKFKPFVTWDFDFSKTEWDHTTYPNGVQDLPNELKTLIREGGRAKLVLENSPRVSLFWKGSPDLSMFQWEESKTKTSSYSHRIPINSIRIISRGINTKILQNCAAKDRKVNANVCLSISGPVTENFPNGVELNLKLKTKSERDQLLTLLCEWRDAAIHGV